MPDDNKTIRVGFVTERMLLGFGVDLVIDRVASGLAEQGHQVKVFSSLVDETYQGSKYEIDSIPTPAFDFFPLYERSACRWLKHLNSQEIDVYLVETFPYYSLLPRLKKPVIAVDHGVCPTTGFSLWKKLNFNYMAKAQYLLYFRFATRIITISQFVKRSFPQGLQNKTKVIYNGVDHYRLKDDWEKTRKAMRRKHDLADDEILLLYVGRLNPAGQPYKGVADLLEVYQEAKKANRKIRLMTVGLGDANDEAMLREQGVIPHINAPVSEMPSFYLGCDIYVTASYWEGFDLPLMEAQYFGKPGVAFQIGAHPEVVLDGQTALLVASKKDFLQAVLHLAEDRSQRLKMGEEARRHAANFSWRKAVGAYDNLIKEVVL